MFRTLGVTAGDPPSRRHTVHTKLAAALEAWLADCRTLRTGSGDRADFIDEDGGEHLRWVAAEPPYASGALADAACDELDDEGPLTPERLPSAVRTLLAPAPSSRVLV